MRPKNGPHYLFFSSLLSQYLQDPKCFFLNPTLIVCQFMTPLCVSKFNWSSLQNLEKKIHFCPYIMANKVMSSMAFLINRLPRGLCCPLLTWTLISRISRAVIEKLSSNAKKNLSLFLLSTPPITNQCLSRLQYYLFVCLFVVYSIEPIMSNWRYI